ncbi:MAG: glycosyltransferase family A protein [Ilumatobacter sp.]|uniref:glycosyltransferase n=1 Tax=Ilumatobacter sp. TaxID=1967498 RepID=UPI003C758928
MKANDVVRRGWKEYADLRRRISRSGSDESALRHFDDANRSDIDEWNRITADRHAEYRAAQTMPFGSVAVVCVTNRPKYIGNIVDNVMRQTTLPEHVAVVVNLDEADADLVAVDARLEEIRRAGIDVVLSWRPASKSLGFCLNVTMAATDARFVAKFDDDDRYGPHFLADSLRAHSYAGAGIVGKHTTYARLEDTDATILRFPGNEFIYTATLAGPTLVIDRERAGGLWFRDISLGEDRAIVTDCNKRGIPTFAADRFNFVYRRTTGSAWGQTQEEFVRRSMSIGTGLDLDDIDR